MAKWKVLLTDGMRETGMKIFGDKIEVVDRNGISPAELLDEIGAFDGVIVRGRTKMTKVVIEQGERLKIIGRAGVGVDNIDLAAAQSAGITVVNAPIASTQAVAEHTIGLLLSVLRHISLADQGMKSGQWHKKDLVGTELGGKTLGLIGLGRIGSRVAELALAFDMDVVAYDPSKEIAYFEERSVRSVVLNDIYARSDIISMHLPLSPKSRRMISGQEIGYMKPGVVIVCTARGGMIDETALLAGLESGQVAGAGLDVFADEPPGLTALVAHPRVVATPHIGAQTTEAQDRAAVDIATEVLTFLEGKELRWKIV